MITASGIAPIFHRRYLLYCAMPLALLTLAEICCIRLRAIRWPAILLVAASLVYAQGSWQFWQKGLPVGTLRGEDWRSAKEWVESKMNSNDQLWVASGLMEGAQATPPLEPSMDAYLSFPFRGNYKVELSQGPRNRLVEPKALVGNANQWLFQLLSEPSKGTVFIVARCDTKTLQEILHRLKSFSEQNQIEFEFLTQPRSYGLISAAHISVRKP